MRALAAVLALVAVVAACGGDDDDGGGAAGADTTLAGGATTVAGPSGTEGSEATATSDAATADTDVVDTEATDTTATGPTGGDVDPDGTLRIAYHLTPTSMDPIGTSVHQVQSYLWPIYDGLLRLSPSLEVEPMLATEWEFTPDGLGLHLQLRDDVTFHDGTPFDAEAVKVNIERTLAATESPVRGFLANVEGVTVNGPYDVTIDLTAPDAALPTVLAHRPGLMISPTAIANGTDISQNDAGSGPYTLTEVAIGDHAVYERNDDYWQDGEAGTKRLEITGLADGQARVNGVISDQFDMAYLTPSQLDQAESSGLEIVAQDTTWYIQLFQNRAHANLDNLQVRQAVAHAIDREAICTVIYVDQCEPTSSILPPDFWAQDPTITPDYFDYDPEKATQLLTDSGFSGQAISIAFPAGADPYPQFAELLQAQLDAVGFDVTLVPADINTLADVYQVKQSVDMLLAGGGQQADPALMLANQFTSTAAQNPGKTVPAGLDELVAEARAAVDVDERTDLMHEVTRTIAEEVIDLPLVAPKVMFVINADHVASYTPTELGAYLAPRGITVHP